MKILVTGANGYLGQGIVKSIVNSGNEVIATDLAVDKINEECIKKPCRFYDRYTRLNNNRRNKRRKSYSDF